MEGEVLRRDLIYFCLIRFQIDADADADASLRRARRKNFLKNKTVLKNLICPIFDLLDVVIVAFLTFVDVSVSVGVGVGVNVVDVERNNCRCSVIT